MIDYTRFETETLREAEAMLRFQGVNHASDFRSRQIQRKLADVRAELATRATRRDCLAINA